MSNAVELKNITKRYKKTVAVNALDMEVPKGVIYGLLGRNGAGKTTTINIIMGLVRPNTGSVHVLGKDARKHREYALSNMGAIVESPSLYRNLTAEQNLQITADLHNVDKKRVDEVLQITGILNEKSKKVKHYSTGMKQRLGIANALIHSPKIIILDEPTNGLDPEGVSNLRDFIKSLNKQLGITVIMSSHILSEVEQVADYVGIIDKGRLIDQFAMNELNISEQNHLLIEVDHPPKATEVLSSNGISYDLQGNEIKVFCDKQKNGEINRLISSEGITIFNMSSMKNSLEDKFLSVVNE